MIKAFRLSSLIVAGVLSLAVAGCTSKPKPVVLQLKDHAFTPNTVTIPANTQVRISIQNLNAIPVEFESYTLHVEKIVVPGQTVSLFVGPLKPGTYTFFNDYDPAATGAVHVSQ